jgi:hypothetical protein
MGDLEKKVLLPDGLKRVGYHKGLEETELLDDLPYL